MGPLRLAVLLALAWAVLALAHLHREAKAYGKPRLFSKPAGDPGRGVRYAFTRGMAPWAKESVMLNLPSYGAGMVFHAGVITALGLLLMVLTGERLTGFALWPVRLLTLAGTLAGCGLLGKRLVHGQLRGLSCPDDFVSNLLCTGFLLLACAATFSPRLAGPWLAEALLLLVYAPLGKVRHCFFFFTTRYHFGAFFGRRGTFPPGGSFHA